MEDEEQLIDFIDHLERSQDHQKIDEILKENEEKFVHWSMKPLQNERIEQLKQVWSNLRSILLVNTQREELLTKPIQLGNRVELEQLRNQIRVFLEQFSSQLSDEQHHELANRQLFLRQMLIDTNQIERLRVNFISEFQTITNAENARSDIQTLINHYPTEMTSQIRQWFNEQHPTTNVIEPFRESLHQLENDIRQYQLNPSNPLKVKNLLQSFDSLPSPPEHLSSIDRQRYLKIKTQLDHIRKKSSTEKSPMNQSIETIDRLIKRIRDYDEQLQTNMKQPIIDYETLLVDCQRILNEIKENLQIQVEHAIHSGKKFYSTDSTDITDSANESCHSPSSSPILKKRSDLTIRKVRRHVLQLGQHWKNLNTNVRYRYQQLERLRTVVEELRGKCDRLHGQLLEIELAYAHTPQIRALTIEQIPTEIEQGKNLLTTVMSYKSSLDEIQQSAQNIEKEYQFQASARTKELQQRWEHSINSINQRLQSLRDAVKNSDVDIYSISVEYPWQRTISTNKRPYYINHADQTTSWDHPKLAELIRSFSNVNDIRFAAYRTAMKLRTLQKSLCLDLTSLNDIRMIFDERAITDPLNKILDIGQTQEFLQRIFDKSAEKYPQLIHVIPTVDLTLNWLLNIYDTNRTGTIRLLAIRIALTLLCRGNIEEKYRYLFSLVAHDTGDRQVADRSRLSLLFQHALVIPKYLGEVAAFGGSNVEPSVQSCFEFTKNVEILDTEDFLQWMKLEPQSLVWLPVMHRLAASEAAKHEARCNICKVYPILGFRYRSLRYFNCDICQTCFFGGKQTKVFKMDHPLQEYYTETTSSEDIRDFIRIFKNKICKKQNKIAKLGYLPLPHVFDHAMTTNSTSTPPVTFISTPNSPHIAKVPTKKSTNDEHGLIAQHCKDLQSLPICSSDDQRQELEGIIADLEEENRILQLEYERLCREHENQTEQIEHEWATSTQNDEMLRQAKELRQYQSKLEQRMKILEEHNQHIEQQLKRSKQILSDKEPIVASGSTFQERVTIDNLFHLADGINRAVGDLVSVISGSD